MHKQVKIGTRESALAQAQARLVLEYLNRTHPDLDVSLVTMKTTGDKILDRKLYEIGGKGLFVKELDLALREGRTDLSVHSLKDLPVEIPDDLPIICCSAREDPRDVLVLPEGVTRIDFSRPVGTSSLRRILQLQKKYPDLHFESVRGNLQTRLRKLDEGQYGALILAAAGLKRLGLEHRINRYFDIDEVIPSAGQGILAVQGRYSENYDYLKGYADRSAFLAAVCERSFVRTLDGGCTSPIAAHARISGTSGTLSGFYATEDLKHSTSGNLEADVQNKTDAEALGRTLAQKLNGNLGRDLTQKPAGNLH